MDALRFEWDANKNAANIRKHRISFEEAESVFSDDAALLLGDSEHSEHESRFVLLGMSRTVHILVVCHCYRLDDDIIRIISARKATRTETHQYNERRRP